MKTFLPLLGAVAVAAQVQSEGCYSSAGSLENQGKNIYQSTGSCSTSCSKSVIATTGNECYCGDELPPSSDKVEDSKCDTPCPGYPYETCGGDGFWSVSTTDAPSNTTSVSTTAPATTSQIVAPTSSSGDSSSSSSMSMNVTATSSTPSTSTEPAYTGAAAQPVMGAGVVAMGALFALL